MSFKEDFKEHYPTYKQICQDTNEKPCIYGFLIWLKETETNIEQEKTDLTQIIDHLRDSDIANKAWETRKQQENMVVIP